MALRDPGAPRRNPLFAVDTDAEIDVNDDAEVGVDPPVDGDAISGSAPQRPTAGWVALGASLLDGSLLGDTFLRDTALGDSVLGDTLRGAPGSAVGPWMRALQEAGPEAAEHLVNAAHEVTLAVKVVIDAVEQALAEQRAVFADERAADEQVDPDPFAPDPSAPDPSPEPRVRRIDVE